MGSYGVQGLTVEVLGLGLRLVLGETLKRTIM